MTGGDMRKAFIRMRANSIEGGTSEVMRNIIGERVLGLPGEPRNDKDVSWKDVPAELVTCRRQVLGEEAQRPRVGVCAAASL